MIDRALGSVFSQEFDNFECIVVDDGSTDRTHSICDKYKINYIKTANLGVSHARNTGAKAASGSWLAFLDSDDQWLPDKLNRQYQFISEYPEIRILHGNEVWIKNGQKKNQKLKHKKSGGDIFQASLKLCLISPSAVVIRKDLFSEHQGYKENFPVCEDYDLWLKITATETVGFIKEPLIIKYGGHEDQLSQKYKAMDYWRVKSIQNILMEGNLNNAQRIAAKKELLVKSDILLKGYKKHNNPEHFEEISTIRKMYL